jgi:hypothetical protein
MICLNLWYEWKTRKNQAESNDWSEREQVSAEVEKSRDRLKWERAKDSEREQTVVNESRIRQDKWMSWIEEQIKSIASTRSHEVKTTVWLI